MGNCIAGNWLLDTAKCHKKAIIAIQKANRLKFNSLPVSYKDHLRKIFPGVQLEAEDLMLLESHQIASLPDRLPEQGFATLLHGHPCTERYLKIEYPIIEPFIHTILNEYSPEPDEDKATRICQDILWEVAEMIIYNKSPETYDTYSNLDWDISEITDPGSLRGKTIIDAGAGSGGLAFMFAGFAGVVYAVEPVASLRRFIKEKTMWDKISNIHVQDGFLDSIPLPDHSVDMLLTSNAMGWRLEKEMEEIERVVRKRGEVFHLIYDPFGMPGHPFYDALCSSQWNYHRTDFPLESGAKYKYSKTIT
jgi:SAM-dependent methyltransferase